MMPACPYDDSDALAQHAARRCQTKKPRLELETPSTTTTRTVRAVTAQHGSLYYGALFTTTEAPLLGKRSGRLPWQGCHRWRIKESRLRLVHT